MGSITNADPVDLQKASDYQLLFERGGKVDDETFLRVLKEAIGIADETGFPYLVMGGIASSAMGRPRWTHDIDLFIRPEDAGSMLEAFAQEGFVTQQTYPDWLGSREITSRAILSWARSEIVAGPSGSLANHLHPDKRRAQAERCSRALSGSAKGRFENTRLGRSAG